MSIKVNPMISHRKSLAFQCRDMEWSHKIETCEEGREHLSALYFGQIGPDFESFPRLTLVFDTTPDDIVILEAAQISDLIATLAELVGLNVVITEQEADDE